MKGKQVLLSILLILVTVLCVAWAGLTVCGVDVLSQVKNVLNFNTTAENIAFKNTNLTLGEGQSSDLDIVMTPKDATTKFTLTSSDASVVKIEDNKAVAVAEGSCTVRVKTENDLKDYCDIRVISAPKSLNIPSKIQVAVGESFSIKPSNCKNIPENFLDYSCDNGNVAIVKNDGSVKIMGEGQAKITVTTYNGVSKTCSVTALKEPTSVSFEEESVSIVQNSTYQLSWVFKKGEGCRKMGFKSSDERIAKVDSKGLVTGIGQGEADITLELFNDVTAKCSIIVTNQFERIRTNLDSTKPMVCLTFDDGPKEGNTDAITKTLEKYNGRGTFFVVGSRVADQADILKRTYESGHEIGSHSWDHQYADSIDEETQRMELNKSSKAIQDVLGAAPTLFRCPGGITGSVYESSHFPLIMWSIDTIDWSTKNTSATYNAIRNVFKKGETLDGDIILMHDIQDSTPKAVEKICKLLSNKGYQMVTVSEMAYYRGVNLKGGETYYNFYR